ncbi:SDR family oxidoreductase [Chroococcidiopsis sp. FACHB-1243]|uniref:SDR family oxidoreductase n=1 Tax=Chroococcidiopsis sp. [FACHB-1243] TaxID=2692781 RepID=UPI00177B5443|nr:SDR family oxidoreductase [Chroococcidiopsis sp. [FACHB-1243]]MBD2309006.1 SDR family oxidoreductase [Chroococcidiopsis sp. [FACHB-1243]]
MTQTTKGAVVITGASTGVGRATALLLDKQGYQVFAGVRREEDAESLKLNASSNLIPIILDITSSEQIQSAAKIVSQAVGEKGLTGLVNNAGILIDGPLEYLAIAELRWQLEVNVIGQVAVTQAFLPTIRKAKGRIINIGSVSGKVASPFFSALCASKFALEALTDALRMELAPWKIEAILIEPGSIASTAPDKVEASVQKKLANMSPIARSMYGDLYKFSMEQLIQSNRMGIPPEEVARAIQKALEVSKPKTRYFLSKQKFELSLLLMLAKILPDRVCDAIQLKELELKN